MTGTIRENLLYGLKREVNDDELWQALDMAYAKNFVQEMDDQLDTQIGERGIKLSGGQRQRIAIAHRLSTIVDADTIYFIDHGTVSGSGKHEELIKSTPLYAEYVKNQFKK